MWKNTLKSYTHKFLHGVEIFLNSLLYTGPFWHSEGVKIDINLQQQA